MNPIPLILMFGLPLAIKYGPQLAKGFAGLGKAKLPVATAAGGFGLGFLGSGLVGGKGISPLMMMLLASNQGGSKKDGMNPLLMLMLMGGLK